MDEPQEVMALGPPGPAPSVFRAPPSGDGEDSIERAKRDLYKFQQLRQLAVALTEPRDWVAFPSGDQGKRAWPTRSACNKLATACKISTGVHQDAGRPMMTKTLGQDENGEYYTIEIYGWAEMPGFRRFDVFGYCSSRHKLFASTGKRDEKGNIIYKPMQQVSEANVRQAAYTNFQANAIMRMLGMDNLSAEDLEAQFGKKLSEVSYASGRSEQTAEEIDQDQKMRRRLWAICMSVKNDVEVEAGKLLADLSKFTVKDDKTGQDRTVNGVTDAAKLKGKRLQLTLKSAEERLEHYCKANPEEADLLKAEIAKREKG
jgi:hypothetical protein